MLQIAELGLCNVPLFLNVHDPQINLWYICNAGSSRDGCFSPYTLHMTEQTLTDLQAKIQQHLISLYII